MKMTGRYFLYKDFVGDRWAVILSYPTNDLLAHIVGHVYWVGYSKLKKSAYHIKDQTDKVKYPIEFINHNWHILKWSL